MDDPAQARAYAEADFSDTDARFIARFGELFGTEWCGSIVDLGCGPGNITFRMADAYPTSEVTGVDGARSMLEIAHERLGHYGADARRLTFVEATLPLRKPPRHAYDGVVSNSLLHHLPDPATLWQTLKSIAQPGAAVLIADLRRPSTTAAARQLVETYAAGAPEVLKRDFYNSLLAAFSLREVADQLTAAGLSMLQVATVGDRHLEVYGTLPA
jgi:trans-aconitate methyltransferase